MPGNPQADAIDELRIALMERLPTRKERLLSVALLASAIADSDSPPAQRLEDAARLAQAMADIIDSP